MNENEPFDVVVVGAGPAGSSLALRLGRAGWRVALLDRKRFPRPKPCGEFLSPQCLPILDDLGVREDVLARGPREVEGMRIYGYGRAALGHYRDIGGAAAPYLYGYGVRREVFDLELLRGAAAAPGVTVLEGCCVDELLRGAGGRVLGVRARTLDGRPVELRATWTVGADGVRSAVARALGVQERVGWLDKFALTTHYTGVRALPTAELHIFPGGYFAATTVDDGVFSLNLVVDTARLKQPRADWDGFFAAHLAQVPELAERLATANRSGPVRGVGPLAWRTTRQVFEGAVLVGDACGYVDPMTGEGIYFALRGAECLAASLLPALERGQPDPALLRGYLRARRREIGPRLVLNRLLQRGLRRGSVARTVLTLLQSRPGVADLLVSLTGDYVAPSALWRPRIWRDALLGRPA